MAERVWGRKEVTNGREEERRTKGGEKRRGEIKEETTEKAKGGIKGREQREIWVIRVQKGQGHE